MDKFEAFGFAFRRSTYLCEHFLDLDGLVCGHWTSEVSISASVELRLMVMARILFMAQAADVVCDCDTVCNRVIE